MAKERRQFIGLTDTQAESFNGLDREITVSTDSDTLRLHTTEEPHGILLAKQSDLSSTSETVSQQGEAISGLDGRVTTLENNANGDMRGFTHLLGVLCNLPTADSDIASVYPYMARIFTDHLTPQNHDTIAYVMFSPADAVSGNFAPFVTYESAGYGYEGYVIVYSKVEMTETHYAKVALVDIRRADSNG